MLYSLLNLLNAAWRRRKRLMHLMTFKKWRLTICCSFDFLYSVLHVTEIKKRPCLRRMTFYAFMCHKRHVFHWKKVTFKAEKMKIRLSCKIKFITEISILKVQDIFRKHKYSSSYLFKVKKWSTSIVVLFLFC